MSLDVPSHGQPVSGNFAVSGWAIDLGVRGAVPGTGVDTVHVWAQSVSTGAWIWLGAANMGVSRPDVAAVFQSAQFATAGFGMSATLPPGTYDVNVFAHSLISNTFNNVQTKRITVVTPPSRPVMYIDLPVPEFATTRGYALQHLWLGARSLVVVGRRNRGHPRVGVPTNGAPPIMVGATSVGHSRGDVAAIFGPQFVGSGYSLQGALPPGDYNLVVFALSSVAHALQQRGGHTHASLLEFVIFRTPADSQSEAIARKWLSALTSAVKSHPQFCNDPRTVPAVAFTN